MAVTANKVVTPCYFNHGYNDHFVEPLLLSSICKFIYVLQLLPLDLLLLWHANECLNSNLRIWPRSFCLSPVNNEMITCRVFLLELDNVAQDVNLSKVELDLYNFF